MKPYLTIILFFYIFVHQVHAHYTNLPTYNLLYQPYEQDLRLLNSQDIVNGERHIVIVTCSYNNKQFTSFYCDSLIAQNYKNFHVIYIDDASTDGTTEEVLRYARFHKFDDKLILLTNSQRRLALANLYFAIHLCKDRDIIVIVDGDDRFASSEVLSRINELYSDQNIWLTYGQFREYPNDCPGFCKEYDEDVSIENSFRYQERAPSHLRTFYAALFKKIKVDDLMFKGEFFPMCYDVAIMFPMIEMARFHFKFIPDILLDYNTTNPLNDHKISKKVQSKCDVIIRARTCYRELDRLFD